LCVSGHPPNRLHGKRSLQHATTVPPERFSATTAGATRLTKFIGKTDYQHGEPTGIGILIANLGTPDAPDARSLRRYLAEFLSDPRVVEVPRPIWWLILNLIILNFRPKKSARAYASVWTEEGSPLLVNSKRQLAALSDDLQKRLNSPASVKLGMRYGTPSIKQALDQFADENIQRIFVLPLYPQYSGSTTASVFDAVFEHMKKQRWVPSLRTCSEYYEDEGYIAALAQSVREHREQHGSGDTLLFSFHGIPQRYFRQGDPYHCHCQATAERVAKKLDLTDEQWSVSFQSRFGREPWLSPYTDEVLKAMPAAGIKAVDIICPGFAADCVETLEEIELENRHCCAVRHCLSQYCGLGSRIAGGWRRSAAAGASRREITGTFHGGSPIVAR